MPFSSYAIAQGFNGSVTNFESIAVTGGEDLRLSNVQFPKFAAATYYHVATLEGYTIPYTASSVGSFTQNGYPTVSLRMPRVGVTSYKYLIDTYGQKNTTYRGKVTVNLRSDEFDVFDEYNAILFVEPANAETVECVGSNLYYENVILRFKIIEAT